MYSNIQIKYKLVVLIFDEFPYEIFNSIFIDIKKISQSLQ